MAVSSNPNPNQTYQNQQQTATGNPGEPNAVPSVSNGNDVQQHNLKHDPGISMEWTAEEQAILEDGNSKYGSESTINRYIKIAALLPEKTVRDVALRCRWMLKKDNEKKKKDEQNTKKSKDKKDKPVDSKPIAPAVRAPPVYLAPVLSLDSDDGIPSEAIAGPVGQLFEQNTQLISQINVNVNACKLQENIELLARFRDNLITIWNGVKDAQGIINQMPPLPVVINMELGDALLPKSTSQMIS